MQFNRKKGETLMRATYKKIGVVIIVLLLGVGSAVLWQSLKQTKTEKGSTTKTPLNKEQTPLEARIDEAFQQLSDPTITPDQRKNLNALLDEYFQDEAPISERQITLPNGETVSVKEYLRDVDELLQASEAASVQTQKYIAERRKAFKEIEKERQQWSKEREALLTRWDKAQQKIDATNEKMEKINPLIDRLHTFFGTTPNVIPKPPDDATPEEKIAFYEDLQQKMEQDPNYLRSIQPELTGRSASQTPKTGVFHTLQNADKQNLDTADFQKNAQSQITSLRTTLETQYFDVIITPSLTPEEFDNIFPTEKEREILQTRKNEMTQHVVKNLQRFLSDNPNDQKISVVRELLTQNFDKDFADAVIEKLQLDEK